MNFRSPVSRVLIALSLIHAILANGASGATSDRPPELRRPAPSWGAIAAQPRGYGYSFNQRSQAAAEQVALAQCERPPGRKGSSTTGVAPVACEVRTAFERSCAALVTGNFGEWGTAVAPTKEAAGKAAIAECNAHLPTEPCKLVVSVCSPG